MMQRIFSATLITTLGALLCVLALGCGLDPESGQADGCAPESAAGCPPGTSPPGHGDASDGAAGSGGAVDVGSGDGGRRAVPIVPVAGQDGLRVLFIGNSYTFVNDLPGMLHRIAETSGVAPAIDVAKITKGGATLSYHWVNADARPRIAEGGWSHVILQGQSQEPSIDPESGFQVYARKFSALIEETGAVPAWYVTWARATSIRPGRDQDELTSAYAQAAASSPKCVLACVGEAFRHVRDEYPEIVLHAADGSHPNLAGTYLAASTFYVALTGGAVPPASEIPAGVSTDMAAVLQEVALVGSSCSGVRIKADISVVGRTTINFGRTAVPNHRKLTLRNTGQLTAGLSIVDAPTPPFSFTSGTYPGLTANDAADVPPCGASLDSGERCSLSLTFSGESTSETGMLTLGLTQAYALQLRVNLIGRFPDYPILQIHRLEELPTATARPRIQLEAPVGATLPLDLLVTNVGGATGGIQYPALKAPYSWGPLDADLNAPGGVGEQVLDGQTYSYCQGALPSGETCLVTLNYRPTEVGAVGQVQCQDRLDLRAHDGPHSKTRTLCGNGLEADAPFDPGPPRCPTTMLFRGGHCYDFDAEIIAQIPGAARHAMVMATDGSVHVAYYDDRTRTLQYTRREGSDWTAPVSFGTTSAWPLFDFAIDREGASVVVFEAPTANGQGIAWARIDTGTQTSSGGWVRQGVGLPIDLLQAPKLAFDSSNTMHVSYTEGRDDVGLYATMDPLGQFSSATFSGGDAAGIWSELAVTPGGKPHIFWASLAGAHDRAYLATRDGGVFTSQPVSGAAEFIDDYMLEFELDGQDQAHALYFELNSSQLRHAVLENGTWQSQVLLEPSVRPTSASMKLAASRQPHVAWKSFNGFQYLWVESGKVTSIDLRANISSCNGEQVTLALDSGQVPHVICGRRDGDTLLYVAPRQLW